MRPDVPVELALVVEKMMAKDPARRYQTPAEVADERFKLSTDKFEIKSGKDAVKEISDEYLQRFPVEAVSWDDAQLFLAELNKREQDGLGLSLAHGGRMGVCLSRRTDGRPARWCIQLLLCRADK